ncbi:M23 family metallopeptidase [Patescibacteria group bacterium]
MKKILLSLITLALLLILGAKLTPQLNLFQFEKTSQPSQEIITRPPLTPEPKFEFALPVAEFKNRVTKKPFGIFITQKNSPVQPERFSGYHTGVDVEYQDIASPVPVFAICDGEIVFSQWVSGYGGALGLKCQFENQNFYALYGHLELQSLTQKIHVKKGDFLANLGENQTQTTDFERKHLHLSLSKNILDFRGYVNQEDKLSQWHNPEELLLTKLP